jgi:hypothetical protein
VGNKVDRKDPEQGRIPEAFRQRPIPQKFYRADLATIASTIPSTAAASLSYTAESACAWTLSSC